MKGNSAHEKDKVENDAGVMELDAENDDVF